jgi:tyrosinase
MRRAILTPLAAICLIACGALTGCYPVRARVDISTLNVDSPQIVDLARAVRKMKDLSLQSPKDCRSWDYQAAIHGIDNTAYKCGPNEPWNNCQHANYYFLAWHRMYLYSFEKLVQQLSGDSDFRMPYWNWAAGSPDGAAKVPRLFMDSQLLGGVNPLYVLRNPSIYDQGSEVTEAFASTFFSQNYEATAGPPSFGGSVGAACGHYVKGSLEGSAHDNVHCELGGDMYTPASAARDPIFYLHHANIDRLWESWAAKYGQNPTDSKWLNQEFSFCSDPGNGHPGVMKAHKVSEFLNTRDLGYEYDWLEQPAVKPIPPVNSWVQVAVSQQDHHPLEPTHTIELHLTRDPARTIPTAGARVLSLVFRNLTSAAKLGVLYRVQMQEEPAGPDSQAQDVGKLTFYSFGMEHADHAAEVTKQFLLPDSMLSWFSRGVDSPATVFLVTASLYPGGPIELNPDARPTIGSVEVYEGR